MYGDFHVTMLHLAKTLYLRGVYAQLSEKCHVTRCIPGTRAVMQKFTHYVLRIPH